MINVTKDEVLMFTSENRMNTMTSEVSTEYAS